MVRTAATVSRPRSSSADASSAGGRSVGGGSAGGPPGMRAGRGPEAAAVVGDRFAVVPEFVDFSRVFNFRDLGGYETTDGRAVRPGLLFRADNLGGLKEEDRERFAALGIRTIVDLRQPREID